MRRGKEGVMKMRLVSGLESAEPSGSEDASLKTQVPSGMATRVGNKVFLSITMPVVDLLAASTGVDLPGKGMTLRGAVD